MSDQNSYSLNNRSFTIDDIDYRYSLKSDIHSISLSLKEHGEKALATYNIALRGSDLDHYHYSDKNKKIDPRCVLGVKIAEMVTASLFPEMVGQYSFVKRYTYSSYGLLSGNNLFYRRVDEIHSSGNLGLRDIDVIRNTIKQCLYGLEGYFYNKPTEVLKTKVVPLRRAAI